MRIIRGYIHEVSKVKEQPQLWVWGGFIYPRVITRRKVVVAITPAGGSATFPDLALMPHNWPMELRLRTSCIYIDAIA
jgi:hypothetical protein